MKTRSPPSSTVGSETDTQSLSSSLIVTVPFHLASVSWVAPDTCAGSPDFSRACTPNVSGPSDTASFTMVTVKVLVSPAVPVQVWYPVGIV